MTCQRVTQISLKEATPDKPLCAHLTLEVKRFGIENTAMALWVGIMMFEQEGVNTVATSKHYFDVLY